MAEQWNEKEVFLGAANLPPAEREAFLRRSCPDDAARARIEALLQHHARSTELFASTPLPAAPPTTLVHPEKIDEFRIIAPIGEGGMGVVYLAEDTILGRKVALKVIAGHLVGSETALARFREEARSAAALRHPAIVPVYKFGFDGARHYLASEYVDGPTLAAVIEQERQRRQADPSSTTQHRDWFRRCAEVVSVIAEALDTSHKAGIIHRDVKPSNILIDRERGPRLTDFGIAKHLTEEARTQFSGAWGSCHYMSPEQASIAGVRVDQRSDIFSLGVVLYEMLSLRLPFDGGTVSKVLEAVTTAEPARLRTIDRSIPLDLETICRKALEKDPARRYQTAAHLGADLRCWREGRPILARPPGTGRRLRRWAVTHRFPAAISTAAAALVLVGVLAWALRYTWNESRAWLTVESEVPGCTVYYQQFDVGLMEFPAVATRAGGTPSSLKLVPGHYRVTVVAEDRRFAEATMPLLDRGHAGRTVLRVDRTQRRNAADNESGGDVEPRVKHATLVSSEVARDGMIRIDAGEHLVGHGTDDNPLINEHTVRLPEFLIDRAEVSNAEYKDFVTATGHAPPGYWTLPGYQPELEDRPVVGITFDDAEAYARWRGKRLPTSFEWEAAARAPDGRLYTWGDRFEDAPEGVGTEPDPDDLRRDRSSNPAVLFALYKARSVRVQLPDPAGCRNGLLHVCNNVLEMTESVYPADRAFVMKGNSWVDFPCRTLANNLTYTFDANSFKLGFRCARSVDPPPFSP
jgi:formylglycine-generating enzyme required for sulfatase activity